MMYKRASIGQRGLMPPADVVPATPPVVSGQGLPERLQPPRLSEWLRSAVFERDSPREIAHIPVLGALRYGDT